SRRFSCDLRSSAEKDTTWFGRFKSVFGVIGYVFPGGGLAALTGAPNVASSVLSPGYQAPYPCTSNGQELGNGVVVGSTGNAPGCNPPGAPTSSWYQLQGSAYAPFGAVLTGSTGDL